LQINAELEEWSGSPTVRFVNKDYRRIRAQEFRDAPARLTERQAIFYRNLISMALALGDRCIPVDFEDLRGRRRYLDRGCIKIAEHARFIEPLRNGGDGTVGTVVLSWDV
jgi:hypothetical protein